jgi:hypothetical protein
MARGRISSSNGGIMGTGIFGFFGTTIKCDSTDDSIYCNIMKLFNLLIVLFVICYMVYIAYTYVLRPYFLSNKRR